jgi:hypothetical protein
MQDGFSLRFQEERPGPCGRTLYGVPYGIGLGLCEIGHGIYGGIVHNGGNSQGEVGKGALGVIAALTPRADSMTGWRWPETIGNIGITGAAGTFMEGASSWHDDMFGYRRFGSSSKFGWIERAWTRPLGVPSGPYGLAVTLVGTAGFALVGSVQAAAGN